MRTFRRLVPLSLVLATCALAATTHAETSDSDPKAVAVADQVMKALGGKERWQALPGLKWTFAVEVDDTLRSTRHHTWDMHGGRHRVEGANSKGERYCVVRNMDGTGGKAWLDGKALEGEDLKKWVDRAHALWTNDSYWFLMPYKLRDPGVHLAYDGEQNEDGKHYDMIELTFEQVGMTPGDHYWVYADRANHRIEKWKYVLQDTQPPPKEYTWEGWEEHDGLWFPTVHRAEGRAIYTRDVETMHAFDAKTFTEP